LDEIDLDESPRPNLHGYPDADVGEYNRKWFLENGMQDQNVMTSSQEGSISSPTPDEKVLRSLAAAKKKLLADVEQDRDKQDAYIENLSTPVI
jgi:hypothetical protein